MEIKIDSLLERDMDFLIMEEFIADKDFAKIFLDTVQISGDYVIDKAYHSKVDADYGESDLVFVLNFGDFLHAIHIEDKVDAPAMPEQHERYYKRAEKEIANGEYDTYSVVIAAPEKYLDKNSEAKKYTYQVSYEKLYEFFIEKKDDRSMFKAAMIERAIVEHQNGYQWTPNEHVQRFCKDMYAYQKEHFAGMHEGTYAWWPEYKTIYKNLKVVFKSNLGYCDLAFSKMNYAELYRAFIDKIYENMTIVKTNKSSAIRISVNPIKFEDDFNSVKEDVHSALAAVKELLEFGNSIENPSEYGLKEQ